MGSVGPDKDSWIRASTTYKVPNITLNDPANRKLRVITIGAGVSGVRDSLIRYLKSGLTNGVQIMMAYKIQEECENVEHVIYERNPCHGGTYVYNPASYSHSTHLGTLFLRAKIGKTNKIYSWFENRYPGCACDVPSHAYTYPWAPNPEWPRFLAESKDIVSYIDTVIEKLELAKYIHVNHQIAGCVWDEERGKWKVRVQRVKPKKDWSSTEPLEVLSEFEDECDVLLQATGILNRWDYPDIKGLWDFKGKVSALRCGLGF